MNLGLKMRGLIPAYCLVLSAILLMSLWGSRTVTVLSESAPIENRSCIILDPGHGGIDGGATSCTGILEKEINLEIALRLNDLFHLLGKQTIMLRTDDRSIHTSGDTIAKKKISDLKHRVQVINETPNAFLISIHQNHYPDRKYYGPQVFYSSTQGSSEAAFCLQSALIQGLAPQCNRKSKAARGVYLMEHIECSGLLIECGFLSNPEEEAKLTCEAYQKKLCCVIASTICNFLDRQDSD